MSSPCSFVSVWKQFYEKAQLVVTPAGSPLLDEDVTKIQSILKSLTTFFSTLDGPKKELAVAHGALGLAVRGTQRLLPLLNSRSACSAQTIVIGLKACQICVLRNPPGRAMCRSEGVFGLLSSILQITTSTMAATDDADSLLLQSETYTTLAAACLGNDLNALFATITYGEMVESESLVASQRLKMTLSTPCSSRLHQTLTYLQALFKVMRTEQKHMLEKCTDPSILLRNVQAAEKCLQRGIRQERNHQWSQCETTCTRALHLIEFMTLHTKLLDDMLVRLLDCRSAARLELQSWNGVLEDVQLCLSTLGIDNSQTAKGLSSAHCRAVALLQARRSDALKELGHWQESKAALNLALQMSPVDRDKTLLNKKKNLLQLAKNKNTKNVCDYKGQRRRPKDNNARQHKLNAAELESWLARAGKRHPPLLHARQQRKGPKCTALIAGAAVKQTPFATNNVTTPGTCVKSLYGIGTVQEVRKCGTTKIQLESWSPGSQPSTAYLRPEFYTVVNTTKPGTCVKSLYGIGTVQEVRKCGTTKIQLESWSPGSQPSTAYLMPEFYTVVSE